MESECPKLLLLHALRARLELDASLGSPFAAISRDQLESAARQIRPFAIQRGTEKKAEPAPESGRNGQRFYKPQARTPTPPAGPPANQAPQPPFTVAGLVPDQGAVPSAKDPLLQPMREQAMQCVACDLCEKRTTVVWGEGSLDASVMFIGEGPGRDEDLQGRPFVGRSGRVLTDIIEKGMKLPRSHVYITNVVKCRPPGNRDPRPDEVAACNAYLSRQIEVIKPSVIVAVGGVAGRALLGLPPKSPNLRGKWHEYNGIPLRVIFHPSYLLRQRRSDSDRTKADRDTWADILEVMKKANGEI